MKKKKLNILPSNEQNQTHYVDHGCQEVNEDWDEDDYVSCCICLVDPAAGFPQRQRQTFVVFRRGNKHQPGVEDDQDWELDHHCHQPAKRC